MNLDTEAVKRTAEMMYVTDARDIFGDEGSESLTMLLDGVRAFFKRIPPDEINATLIFVGVVEESGDKKSPLASVGGEIRTISVEDLPVHRLSFKASNVITVHVRSHDTFDIVLAKTPPSVVDLATDAIVLVNESGTDSFYIGDRHREMPKLAPGAASNFASPTINDLNEALERYRRDAAHVTCPILAEIWEGGRDGPRLVFKNKPESTMRRSLAHFLSTRLRGDVSVRQEHNTDETKPVDLVVNWFGTKMRALIEIKWLGASISASQNKDGSWNLTRYTDGRAQDGADQLVDYLDREATTDPSVLIKGYLVVFDGRRRGIKSPASRIKRASGEYYRDRSIKLSRDYAEERGDIAPLVRYFLEPRSSAFAPAN